MKTKVFILTLCFLLLARADIMAGDFTDNGDNTVTDNNTGLMWLQGESDQMTWENTISYCEELEFPLKGHADWRLPNIKELETITDDTLYNPVIDTNFFPDAHASNYWSSTTSTDSSSFAWFVGFYGGYVDIYNKSSNLYVRCVRGGQ